MNKAAIGIVEKLERKQSFTLSEYGSVHKVLANPDGPEAAAIIMEMVEALRVSAQAFRLLEEVAVAQLEHDKARNFIKLGDMCRNLITKVSGK